jgi:glycosyltransferase involved in cell wall biosynthesis
MPARFVELPALPMHNHPGVWVPMPFEGIFKKAKYWDFDVVLGQTASELMELGLWLRRTKGIPLVCVNTVHVESVYPVVMPEALHDNAAAHWLFRKTFLRLAEGTSADVYNESDGLIVLCKGLEQYWRDRGVRAPIHVIPRNVEPKIFDAPVGGDPFPKHMRRGARLLVVCRHTREKAVERLLRVFARWVAPQVPEATLTLVGDGPDHDVFRRYAEELDVSDRCWFPGEFPVTDMPTFYRHADVFVYASLSETYGQVVSEALWCGLPVVAYADGMGVSHQVEHDITGMLVEQTGEVDGEDWRFGRSVVSLLRNPRKRHALSVAAERHARERCAPDRNVDRFFMAFEAARRHADATVRQHLDADNRWADLQQTARWTAINGIVYGLGRVRSPAVVNRHGRKQPTWNDLLDEAARTSSPTARRAPRSA